MKKIILTVDDITAKNTVAITDYLISKDITPVFFAWGGFVDNMPEPAVYALQKGIVIGNHTYSHKNLSEIPFEEGIEEIEKCEAVLERIYKEAGVPREHKLFRFPYLADGGENRERYIDYLRANGFERIDDSNIKGSWYLSSGWDKGMGVQCSFDCHEYMLREGSPMTMEKIFSDIDEEFLAPSKDGDEEHIVLIHSHDETEEREPLYYERIIERFLCDGAEFIKPRFTKA